MSYRPTEPTETITVPADVLPYPAGGEPLTVTMRTNLTRKDLRRFNDHNQLPKPHTLEQNERLYAPHMAAWSWAGEPPPASAGWEQLELLPAAASWWIIKRVADRLVVTSNQLKAEIERTAAAAATITAGPHEPAC